MQYTLGNVLADVGAMVDQDTSTPSGTELTNRVQFVNRAQLDWANSYKWKDLNKTYSPTILLSMVSIGLPADFREFSAFPYDASVTSNNKYTQIDPQEKEFKLSTDKYLLRRGDLVNGYYMEINPALPSGVSLVVEYYSYPSSVATLNDKLVCPSREFMAKRVSYYVLQARSDSRFPLVFQESNDLLSSLIAEQDSPSEAEDNRIPDWARRNSFRIGKR